jgi:uncharacterized membrane protein YcfT
MSNPTIINRVDWLDFARGVSIVLVVLFHASIQMEDRGLTSSIYWVVNDFFSPIRMPVFFLISGVLSEKYFRLDATSKLLWRIFTLTYIYILWSLVNASVTGELSFNLAQITRYVFTLNPTLDLWFIWAIVVYSIIAKIAVRTNFNNFLAIAFIISLVSYSELFVFENYIYNNVVRFLPFFLFGVYKQRIVIESALAITLPILLASVLLFIFGFLLLWNNLLPDLLAHSARLGMAILGVIVGLGCSIWACRFDTLKVLPIFVGRRTLEIYVAHPPIIYLLAILIGDLHLKIFGVAYWAVPTISVVAIVLSIGLKQSLENVGITWFFSLPTGKPIFHRRPARPASLRVLAREAVEPPDQGQVPPRGTAHR